MNIRIEAQEQGRGVRVWADGRELHHLTDVDVAARIDDVLRVTLGVIVSEAFSFEGDAALHITAVVPPGFLLSEKVGPDGTKEYRATPDHHSYEEISRKGYERGLAEGARLEAASRRVSTDV